MAQVNHKVGVPEMAEKYLLSHYYYIVFYLSNKVPEGVSNPAQLWVMTEIQGYQAGAAARQNCVVQNLFEEVVAQLELRQVGQQLEGVLFYLSNGLITQVENLQAQQGRKPIACNSPDGLRGKIKRFQVLQLGESIALNDGK